MVLIFLLILAFLGYGIFHEWERVGEVPKPEPAHCPDCENQVEVDWLLCPYCRSLLKESCEGCGHLVYRYFRYCPHCGTRRGGGS